MADAGDVHYLLQLPDDLDTSYLIIEGIDGETNDGSPHGPPPKD